ncbi:hypothetical protein BHE74_00013685 [Ensete ventricosum]|nr:hypothetical protein BHE74_00013685 [Ensete ventricosum]RZS19674.1 hypothetical protein BHM03_00052105 [Ensete ventricosum]
MGGHRVARAVVSAHNRRLCMRQPPLLRVGVASVRHNCPLCWQADRLSAASARKRSRPVIRAQPLCMVAAYTQLSLAAHNRCHYVAMLLICTVVTDNGTGDQE